ncbi:hypothetical protein Leryth_026073, partial [Lithospermum erythrorhizon]
ARIEVARRRAEAKQRFLKEDLAKLLVNGLDKEAFSRTEEYLALQNILDSYDFVEQTCEYISEQLPCMQKLSNVCRLIFFLRYPVLRECPEECREAVGSLIFAAARFSDLPELRDLRDLLKERYGNSLESFVNQKVPIDISSTNIIEYIIFFLCVIFYMFLEKLSSRPPEMEGKINLLKDIASEKSLKWDVKGFEQRMALPSARTRIQSPARKHESNYVAPKDYNQLITKDGSARPDNCEYPTKEKRSELASGVDKMRRSAKVTFSTRENNIQENNKEGVSRHGHVNDGEKEHNNRGGFKGDNSTPETYRRDETKQRPELDKAKDQALTGTEKKPEVARDGGKMHRSVDWTFNTRVDKIPEPNNQDVLRHRHMHVDDSKEKHSVKEGLIREFPESDRQGASRDRHQHVNDCENKCSDRKGFIREYSTAETGRRDATKQRPELDKAKDQAPEVTDVEYLQRNKPVIHNPNSVMEGRPDILLPNGKEAEAGDKFRANYAKEDTCRKTLRSRRSHDTIRSENVDTGFMIHNDGGQSPAERQDIPSASNYRREREVERLRTDVLGAKSVPASPYRSNNSMLPPPYRPRDSNHKSGRGSRHENSVSDRPSVDRSFHNRYHHSVDFSERIQKEAHQSKYEKERAEWIPPKEHYLDDFDHDHNGMIPLPKPRAIRRKHRRSLTHDNVVGSSPEAGAIRRSSSSRRREHSRKGLQILSDDEKPEGDTDEKIIDKMLLHYCKKPSNYGIEKPPKSNAHPSEQSTVHGGESSRDRRRAGESSQDRRRAGESSRDRRRAGESSQDRRRGVHDEKSEDVPGHTRSFSVPVNHTGPPENIKAFTRVNSYQPDKQQRHVHPKLPDYDDFVARLAALRGKGAMNFQRCR